MPRKSSEKKKTLSRKAKQKENTPKKKIVGSFHQYPPSGAGLALLAASMMKSSNSR